MAPIENSIRVGVAGWSLPKSDMPGFESNGTHLERYSRRFACVEINSTFRRSHRPATYVRWAQSTPPDFRFAVKLPKQITHVDRLVNVASEIGRFSIEMKALGQKLGAVLVQLPPSLDFDAEIAFAFFQELQSQVSAPAVCEPRHVSWFLPMADVFLSDLRIARVAADPSVAPGAAVPGGWAGIRYFRWHGSPRTYYSRYDDAALAVFAQRIAHTADGATETWCIFDNTAAGAAMANALAFRDMTANREEKGQSA